MLHPHRGPVPLLCLALLALLACDPALPSAPEATSIGESPVAAAHSPANGTGVYQFSDMSQVGSSTLNRHGNSVSMTIHTSGIPAGMAVTVWWVVFNVPENCATSPCGEPDIFDPAVRADVLYAAGHVTGNGPHRNFAGQLRRGDASGSIMPFFNALLGIDLPSLGLERVDGAEIHLVVRTHQQAIPAYMPDMISTFNGGCTYPPGVPTDFGAPGPNTCSDLQFAIHQP